jgi:phage terminase small subunit
MAEEIQEQLLLPGIPAKERGEHYIPTKSGSRLTTQRNKFVSEYLQSYDGTAAAIKAGYSPKSASRIANHLIHNGPVAQKIKEEEEKAIAAAGINRRDALLRLAKMVYWDSRSLYQDDGSIKPPSEWDDATAAVIAGVEVMEFYGGEGKTKTAIGQNKKVKVVDPLRSLEILLRVLGLTKDTPGSQVTVNNQNQIIEKQTIEVVFVNAPGSGEKE